MLVPNFSFGALLMMRFAAEGASGQKDTGQEYGQDQCQGTQEQALAGLRVDLGWTPVVFAGFGRRRRTSARRYCAGHRIVAKTMAAPRTAPPVSVLFMLLFP